MMYSIELLNQDKCLHFVGSGRLTSHEIGEAKKSLLTEQERLRHVRGFLVNLSNVEVLDIRADEIRQLITLDTQLSLLAPAAAVAVVATRDHVFGMARMWEALAGPTGWTIAVFRSRAEADAWMGERLALSEQNDG